MTRNELAHQVAIRVRCFLVENGVALTGYGDDSLIWSCLDELTAESPAADAAADRLGRAPAQAIGRFIRDVRRDPLLAPGTLPGYKGLGSSGFGNHRSPFGVGA